MKAIVYTRHGLPDVLQLQEVEKPVPKDDEVLVKVHAASLNAYNWRLLNANPFLVHLIGKGLFKLRNTKLDADIAGRVEAVGGNVKQLQPVTMCSGTPPQAAVAVSPSMSVPVKMVWP